MTFEIWIMYVATVLVLMSTPGPSQLLMLSNSLGNGFKRSLMTAWGDLTANMGQMLAASLGLAALIMAYGHSLLVIKWVGVAYLLWLGTKTLMRANSGARATQDQQATSLHKLWLQGFITSASNPKAIVFFAALFPQFITPAQPFWSQFLILSTTYIVIDGLFLCTYGALAQWMSKITTGRGKQWLDRAGGSFMIIAAILLGLKTVQKAS